LWAAFFLILFPFFHALRQKKENHAALLTRAAP
jgi:hypothetical protein